MSREQKLEEARERLVEIAYRDEAKAVFVRADDLRVVLRALSAPKAEDSPLSASVDVSLASLRATANNPSGKWVGASKLAAPKAEAVTVERDHYKNGLQILADTFYKGDQHQDYAKHVLDTAPIDTSPVPAITDDAVERAAKAIHDGPLGASDEEDFGDNKASDWCREVARAALLAAFPSKGVGE